MYLTVIFLCVCVCVCVCVHARSALCDVPYLGYFIIIPLIMEAVITSETSVNSYQTTLRKSRLDSSVSA
jgi:hypothetical protein